VTYVVTSDNDNGQQAGKKRCPRQESNLCTRFRKPSPVQQDALQKQTIVLDREKLRASVWASRTVKLFGDRWRNRGNRSKGEVVHLTETSEATMGERPPAGERSPREDRPKRPRRPGNRGLLDLAGSRTGRASGGVEGMPDWAGRSGRCGPHEQGHSLRHQVQGAARRPERRAR